MTQRALVDVTEEHGQRGRAPGAPTAPVVPVVLAALTLAVAGLAWPAPRHGSPVVAVVVGVVGALVAGPFLAYEVQRWIGWRVVLPLLAPEQLVVSPRPGQQRAPARCHGCGQPVGLLATRAQSWLARAGRCRRCGTAVPRWIAGVEIATGVCLALVAWRLGWTWRLAFAVPVAVGLVPVVAVDVVHQRIPTRFVVVTLAVLTATAVPVAVVADAPGALMAALVGGATYGGFLTFLYLASPRGLGGGDVRLGWLVGAAVGGVTWTAEQGAWGAVPHVLTTAVVAAAIGLVTHLVVAVGGRRTRTLPFAPAMATAALLVGVLAQSA